MLIFARQLDGRLSSLVKKVDELVKTHEAAHLQAFVTFVGKHAAALAPRIREAAAKEGISTPMTIGVDDRKLAAYRLDPSVQTQVLVYRKRAVLASFSLGSPTDADVDAVVKATEKMLRK